MLYDDNSEKSIFQYAKRLEGKTFRDAIDMGQESLKIDNNIVKEETSGYLQEIDAKGSSGHLLEKYYFGYDINSSEEPDFYKVGMELKIAPLKVNSKRQLSSKERMVLTIINYNTVIFEEFMKSHLFKKASKILMIFYVHETNKDKLDYKITDVHKYIIPEEDLPVIMRDYNTIVKKIKSGKAHELSEADTLFLGASTKGANKSSFRSQPNSDILAMQRAFSFKSSYINFIYNNYVLPQKRKEEEIVKNHEELKKKSFEELIAEKLQQFIGMSELEISSHFGIDTKKRPKNIFSILTYRMLGISGNSAAEFIKAGISVKTIRINKKNRIKESMSFRNFRFMEIFHQEWDESELKEMFEQTRFLFVVYKLNENDEYIFKGSQFWNIPIRDLEKDVRAVWELTKSVISNGIVVKKVGNRYINNLPGASNNQVCHVRPHAQNKYDTYPTPDGGEFTKQSFWLNSSYIASQLKPEFFSK